MFHISMATDPVTINRPDQTTLNHQTDSPLRLILPARACVTCQRNIRITRLRSQAFEYERLDMRPYDSNL